jgi:hypothetical protein
VSLQIKAAPAASKLAKKWPCIARFLEVESTGWVTATFHRWDSWTRVSLSQAELATTYEEWAEFYEWRLKSTDDRYRHPGLEEWTDDMVYACRRCAAYARGEDPGEWVPSWKRHPNLAYVDEIDLEQGAA